MGSMRWLLPAVLVACSAPSPSSSDKVDAAAGADDAIDSMPAFVDPAWPADAALPAEFDFPPYATLFAPDFVVVSWRTMTPTSGVLRIGKTDALGTEIPTTTAANLQHVSLTNLAPATAYYYEVSIDGTSAVRKGVFVTPGHTQWRFLASGEFHAPSESSGVSAFADEIRNFRPHVIVESGDMVDDGNDITHWRSYLRTAAPWISNVLLLPAHSNHVNGGGGNGLLRDYFVLPNNERWYTTRYSQVEVFTIDSTNDVNADVMTTEVPWLATEAAAAHDGTDDPTFVIAAWHHPACSSFYSSRASSRGWVQTNLVGTFKANGGVDLILAAHDKYYERSTITGGIPHVITNIGNISPSTPGGNHPDCTVEKTLLTSRSTGLFTVDGNTITAKIIDETGTELDAFTLQK